MGLSPAGWEPNVLGTGPTDSPPVVLRAWHPGVGAIIIHAESVPKSEGYEQQYIKMNYKQIFTGHMLTSETLQWHPGVPGPVASCMWQVCASSGSRKTHCYVCFARVFFFKHQTEGSVVRTDHASIFVHLDNEVEEMCLPAIVL